MRHLLGDVLSLLVLDRELVLVHDGRHAGKRYPRSYLSNAGSRKQRWTDLKKKEKVKTAGNAHGLDAYWASAYAIRIHLGEFKGRNALLHPAYLLWQRSPVSMPPSPPLERVARGRVESVKTLSGRSGVNKHRRPSCGVVPRRLTGFRCTSCMTSHG